MSRFRNDSELSALNRAGRLEGASADLVRVVELALAAREETGGLFDPTVHGAVVAAGYDRDFEFVPADGDALPGSGVAPTETRCAGRVLVDGDSIALAAGVKLDLGGIGKGYAADQAAEVLAVAGPCLVNVGRRHRGPRRLLANRRHPRDHARAHRRRHGDLGPRSAALAARR